MNHYTNYLCVLLLSLGPWAAWAQEIDLQHDTPLSPQEIQVTEAELKALDLQELASEDLNHIPEYNRILVLGGVKLDGTVTDLLTAQASYGHFFDSFWGELLYQVSLFPFASRVLIPQVASGNTSAEINRNQTRDQNQTMTLTSFGVGISKLFTFPQSLYHHSGNLLQDMGVYALYEQLNGSEETYTYQGHGFKADYGLFRKLGRNHLGLKVSFHWSEVAREEAFGQEPKNERRLFLYSTALALNYGLYF